MPVFVVGARYVERRRPGGPVSGGGKVGAGRGYKEILLLLLALAAAPSQALVEPAQADAAAHPAHEPFPLPATLEPAVVFWERAFGEWRRDQIALHDAEDLGVVYRILDLPGEAGDSLSREQRTWLRDEQDRLAVELRVLQSKHAAGRTLGHAEQVLLARIETGGGRLAGAAERVRAQRGTRERFLRGLEISGRYDRWFREIFRSQGLPEDLAYLPHVESSFQHQARSSVGAAGIWQFMPATGRQFMVVNSAVDERLNPITAANGAARYLGMAHRELGDWPLAITSYNHGIGSMRRAKERFGTDFARIVREYDAPSFGFASRNFYAEFLAARHIAGEPTRHFQDGVRYHAPLAVKPLVLEHPLHVRDLSRRTRHDPDALAALNPAWSPKVIAGKSRLPAGVTVWLPHGQPALAEAANLPQRVPAAAQTAERRHRVARGESLWSIAQRHGTTVTALAARNGIDPGHPHLQVGQVLRLPGGAEAPVVAATAPRTHRVARGDTPFRIASTYKVPLQDLLSANNMTARTVIRPGQDLIIPK